MVFRIRISTSARAQTSTAREGTFRRAHAGASSSRSPPPSCTSRAPRRSAPRSRDDDQAGSSPRNRCAPHCLRASGPGSRSAPRAFRRRRDRAGPSACSSTSFLLPLVVGWRRLVLQRRRERRERGLLLGEFDLELPHVDALGLRDVEAPPHELELLFELLVRATKFVALARHRRELRLARRELRFERGDPSISLVGRAGLRRHALLVNTSRDPCRCHACILHVFRSHFVRQCTERFFGSSTSMPSSSASSVRSSISTCLSFASRLSGNLNVPRSSRL